MSAIDPGDTRFQYRFKLSSSELRESIAKEGQKEPIHVLDTRPYRVVDGFRRLDAMQSLRKPTVRAFVHEGLTEDEAHNLAFINNVVRKNLLPIEKANGIYLARQRGRSLSEIAGCLGLSEKQARRYENLIRLPPDLKLLVDRGTLPMTHALALGECEHPGVCELALRAVEEGWSLKQLRSRLPGADRRRRPGQRVYVRIEENLLRVLPIRISTRSSRAEQERVIEALERALAFLRALHA